MRALVCLLVLLLTAACTTPTVAPEKANSYRRIGIVPTMGDKLGRHAQGLTVFGNEKGELALDLGVDAAFAAAAVRSLGPRYEVIDLSRYRDRFTADPEDRPRLEDFTMPRRAVLPPAARALMAEQKLDAYLFIVPWTIRFEGLKQSQMGSGIWRLQGLFGPDKAFLYTSYMLMLIDGRDKSLPASLVAEPVGENVGPSLFGGTPSYLSGPNEAVPVSYWQEMQTNQDAIRTKLDDLIGRSVHQTLRRMKLIEP